MNIKFCTGYLDGSMYIVHVDECSSDSSLLPGSCLILQRLLLMLLLALACASVVDLHRKSRP